MSNNLLYTEINQSRSKTLEYFKILKHYNISYIFVLVTTNSSTLVLEPSNDVRLISTPGYPGYYPSYTNRRFVVVVPEGYNVKLNVLDLYIRSGCYNDYIDIYDGNITFYNDYTKKGISLLLELLTICFDFRRLCLWF